jgi:hypothetical protein
MFTGQHLRWLFVLLYVQGLPDMCASKANATPDPSPARTTADPSASFSSADATTCSSKVYHVPADASVLLHRLPRQFVLYEKFRQSV